MSKQSQPKIANGNHHVTPAQAAVEVETYLLNCGFVCVELVFHEIICARLAKYDFREPL